MFDTLQEFLTKSQDSLNQMDLDVITLEQNPLDPSALSSMFAIIHCIKAAARVHGLSTIENVSHAGEGLLDKLRSGKASPDEEITRVLLELADSIRALMDLAATTGSDDADYSELISRLEKTVTQPQAAQEAEIVEQEPDDEPVVVELDDEMKEVLKDFLQESYENLDRVDSELIALEEQPDNRDLLSSIFRSMHTIKGTCGFFGLEKLEKVTHIGENLLVKLRDGEYSITEEIANGLLSMVDAVRAMLDEISEHGHDGRERYAPLIAQLSELNDHGKLLGGVAAEPQTPGKETADVAIGEHAHIFATDDVAEEKSEENPAAVSYAHLDKAGLSACNTCNTCNSCNSCNSELLQLCNFCNFCNGQRADQCGDCGQGSDHRRRSVYSRRCAGAGRIDESGG